MRKRKSLKLMKWAMFIWLWTFPVSVFAQQITVRGNRCIGSDIGYLTGYDYGCGRKLYIEQRGIGRKVACLVCRYAIRNDTGK